MLVLSRKQKQQIRIGDDVVVTVLQIKGGSVRIGIEAPKEIHVMRGELEDFREVRDASAETGRSNPSSRGANPAQETKSSKGLHGKVLELKLQGVEADGEIVPTRLTEVEELEDKGVPLIRLPR